MSHWHISFSTKTPGEANEYAGTISLFVGLASLLGPIAIGVFRWSSANNPASLDDLAQRLRLEVLEVEEVARLGLTGPSGLAPITVKENPVKQISASDWHDSRESQDGSFLDLDSLYFLFTGECSRRVLLIGDGGAGKTVAASELVLRLVGPRARTTSLVPVRLSISNWDVSTDFRAWVRTEISTQFTLSASQAKQLVEAGRILPVLDGLDEMDSGSLESEPSRATEAVAKLNELIDGSERAPLLVTCRTSCYRALGDYNTQLVADEYVIQRLGAAQIVSYIRERYRGAPSLLRPWSGTLTRIRE